MHIRINKSDFTEVGLPCTQEQFGSRESKEKNIERAKALFGRKNFDNDVAFASDYFYSIGRKSKDINDLADIETLANNYGKNRFSMSEVNVGDRSAELINSFNLDLEYIDGEVPKTYKFFGMDVDEEFESVIKLPSGYVVVDSLLDREGIQNILDTLHNRNNLKEMFNLKQLDLGEAIADENGNLTDSAYEEIYNEMLEAVKTLDERDVRAIVTRLKLGGIYDIYSNLKNGKELKPILTEISDMLKDSVKDSLDSKYAQNSSLKSIILTMVKEESRKKDAVSHVATEIDKDVLVKAVSYLLVGVLIDSWADISEKTTKIRMVMASMDAWSDVNRRILGDEGFFNKVNGLGCMTIGGSLKPSKADKKKMIAFNGQFINGNVMYDEYMSRDLNSQIVPQLAKFFGCGIIDKDTVTQTSNKIIGFDYEELVETFADDADMLLASNIDREQIKDYDKLSCEDLQAISAVDSLVYIDDEAKIMKEQYDFTDPNERQVYLKSVLDMYNTEFRDFRDREDEVDESLYELVENPDKVSNRIRASIRDKAYKDDDGQDTVGNEESPIMAVTESETMMKVRENKKILQRIGKLIYKMLKEVDKDFQGRQ